VTSHRFSNIPDNFSKVQEAEILRKVKMGYFSLISSFIVLLSLVRIATSDSQAVRYDKNVNLFSSTGVLLQVQYARNAGMKGSPILCSQTSTNEIVVCIPTSPSMQSLQDRRAVDKLAKISDGIWFAFAGLAGDGRALLKASRNFCTEYQSKFGSIPSVRSVARYIGELQHESTLTGGKRPYGVQVLLIGAEDSTGKLAIYSSEPSGNAQFTMKRRCLSCK
jgi:20S proteasome alpha/beta subunit